MGFRISNLEGTNLATVSGTSAPVTGTFTGKNIIGDVFLLMSCAGYSVVNITGWPGQGNSTGQFVPQVSIDGNRWYTVTPIVIGIGSTTNAQSAIASSTWNSGIITQGGVSPALWQINVGGFNYARLVVTTASGANTTAVFQCVAGVSGPSSVNIVNGSSTPVNISGNITQLGNQTINLGSTSLQASVTSAFANGTTTRTITTGLALYNSIDILLNITAGGTSTTGTMAIFIQDSVDGGTTWNDLVSSNLFTFGSSPVTQQFFQQGRIATTATQGSAAATATLAAGTVRQGPWGDRLRVQEVIATITGGSVGVTYTISAVYRM